MGRIADTLIAQRPRGRSLGGGKAADLTITMQGDIALENALAELTPELRRTAIPTALRFAGRAVVDVARGLVPLGFLADPQGTLRRSLGVILRRGKGGRGPYAVIGARTGFSRPVERPILIGDGGIDQRIRGFVTRKSDPANYAHLVEFGHFVVRPVRGTERRKKTDVAAASGRTFVAARPFLRPALVGTKGIVRDRLILALRQAIFRHFSKLRGRLGLQRAA